MGKNHSRVEIVGVGVLLHVNVAVARRTQRHHLDIFLGRPDLQLSP